MSYVPHTADDRAKMLSAIGAATVEEMFADIPEAVRLQKELDLPLGWSEFEVRKFFRQLSSRDKVGDNAVCFAGMGSYEHFVAAAVNPLLLRPEFYTAYTPYQPEVAQGTLQCIYEFQSMMTRLTGLPVSNASLYDGGTALAEAIQLLRAHTKKNRVIILDGVNPLYRTVVDTIISPTNPKIVHVPLTNGVTTVASLEAVLDDDTACIVIQQPNFVGQLEDAETLIAVAKKKNIPAIVSTYPISLGLLKAPGDYGADIVVGEGQCFGPGLNGGGPYIGIFTCKKEYVRLMPGRVAGVTQDDRGQRGFVLTLQTREQHIRREKATSNICTNQGLMMLASLFNLAFLGKEGVKKQARLCHQKALYLASELSKIGLKPTFSGAFFNEFVIQPVCGGDKFLESMLDKGILAGVHLGLYEPSLDGKVLVAVTELRDKSELDAYVSAAKTVNIAK